MASNVPDWLAFIARESDVFVNYALIVVSVLGAYVLFYRARTEKQLARANERVANAGIKDSVDKKFDRAIDNLNDENIGVRLRGIYSLSEIATNNDEKIWPIAYILDYFIKGYPLGKILQIDTNDVADEVNYKQQSQRYPIDRKFAIRTLFGAVSEALVKLEIDKDDWENYFDIRHEAFPYFPISHALIYKVDAAFSVFNNSVIHRSTFQEVYFNHATFDGSTIWSCDFTEATLQHAKFKSANLYGCIWNNADLQHAQFNGADLTECVWEHANISNADFRDSENLDISEIQKAVGLETAKLPEQLASKS